MVIFVRKDLKFFVRMFYGQIGEKRKKSRIKRCVKKKRKIHAIRLRVNSTNSYKKSRHLMT